jgi:light-regulated signal transduction histidine kinase (bacteriophytochrome)
MTASSELEDRLSDAKATILVLQEELSATNQGMVALTLELEQRIDERTAELRVIYTELQETNSEVLQTTLELEAANKELEAFSYSVSHDLRAPLRAVAGYSRILLEDHADRLDEEAQKVVSVILERIKKMGELIDALLEFFRLGRTALKCTAVDMVRLTRSVVSTLVADCPDRQIEVAVGSLPVCFGDDVLLRQVLINLIGNAIKYTSTREAARIEIDGWSDETGNVYLIRDNGVGFDMEYAEKLFGIFQRLHSGDVFEGTGVGLSLAQRIIQRHDGRIWAEAKVNEGATFHFTLPKVERAAQ